MGSFKEGDLKYLKGSDQIHSLNNFNIMSENLFKKNKNFDRLNHKINAFDKLISECKEAFDIQLTVLNWIRRDLDQIKRISQKAGGSPSV